MACRCRFGRHVHRCVPVDATTGDVRVWKVPSTPDDPSRAIAHGVVEGLGEAAEATPAAVEYFGHGTTVATNALIQHRGADTGLITTEGFRDLLEIGRQRRPHLYDLQADKPPVLVPRVRRHEVRERLRHDGRIETPLDLAQVREAARALRVAGARSIAVCFLYCYVDSRHEQAARRIVEEECASVFVTCSHEVAPEFREYERLSPVVVNAYLGPVLESPPQVRAGLNLVWTGLLATVYYAVKTLVGPEIPANAGLFRPMQSRPRAGRCSTARRRPRSTRAPRRASAWST